MKPMKISADNISKGAPCKADPNQFTGNISIFLKAECQEYFVTWSVAETSFKLTLIIPSPKHWHFNSYIPLVCN